MAEMFWGGEWRTSAARADVTHPFDGRVIDTVPVAGPNDVEGALVGAVAGAAVMRALAGFDRFQILRRAADAITARASELGKLISLEEGKTLREGVFEATRAAETMHLSAEEAKRLGGEVLPMDGAPGGGDRLGFTLRVPCGVVVAITPFNFPLNLVCHKVGPALAAGNSVILKPAGDTPLSALKLVEILLEAGLPPLGIACLTGAGGVIGEALCRDERVRKISFTGSVEVGERITRVAGVKRLTMELGSNSPLIVLPDADLDKVAAAVIATGYGNAGQVCISTQRVIALEKNYGDVLDALAPKVKALRAGDPLADETTMGPMIRERDAVRVKEWIDAAVADGARVVAGGGRRGTMVEPTLVADVRPEMKLSCDELFGPAVGVTRVADVDAALRLANDSRYGLSAGVFTQDIDAALHLAKRIDSGNIHLNWGPAWRADLIPYGGVKMSGIGKEGPKYAIDEMTERKTVIVHLSPPAARS